ncbi:MAG: FG-GAP repeat protein, partial [Hyphomicrobiaceae bacterium]
DTATAFVAGSNDTIDTTNKAYWTPATNANDAALDAFTVKARDNDGALSHTAIQTTVEVTNVNDSLLWPVQIKGIDISDGSGNSISSAGDVDGDGYDDVIIGARRADPDGAKSAGESYLVFGSALAAEASDDGIIDLATLAASEGVLIKGIDDNDQSGFSVSSAGDVDNDGRDDVIIGARQADPDDRNGAGESYLIFGSALAAEASADGILDLATLTASEGVLIKGIDEDDFSGAAVASAGDIDGDGHDDVIIGASLADPDDVQDAGESYLLFGSALAAEASADGILDLATLAANEGVLIKGIDQTDLSGLPVSPAGDVDGDGHGDIIIGASRADPDGDTSAGESYLVFGSALAAETSDDGIIELATLTASEGVLIKGIAAGDESGFSVSSAGDVDGDGYDDVIIGAYLADPDNAASAGESYLVFGSALTAEVSGDGILDLATLAASEGVRIKGIDAGDESGFSVSSAGDVDGDGYDDVIIGASLADPDGTSDAGESYLVFGSALTAEVSGDGILDLATLTTSQGVLIKGIDAGDGTGFSVSSAGDVDGDGYDDVIIGASLADPDDVASAGESYIVSGALLTNEKSDDGIIDLANYSFA